MSKQRIIRFTEGPFDGVDVPAHAAPEKVIVQTQGGSTYRYENDQTDESADAIFHRMVLTRHRESFDDELREDEHGPA